MLVCVALQVWDEWVARQKDKKHKRDRRERHRDHHRTDSRAGGGGGGERAERPDREREHRDWDSRKRSTRGGTADAADGDPRGTPRSPAAAADAAEDAKRPRARAPSAGRGSPRETTEAGGHGPTDTTPATAAEDAVMHDSDGPVAAATPAVAESRRGEGMDVEDGEV